MAEYVTAEEKRPDGNVVLIVDKEGLIGKSLVEQVSIKTTSVFVSQKKPNDNTTIYVPFSHKKPEIPEGSYTHIFLISSTLEHELLAPLAQKAEDDNALFVYVLPYWLYDTEIEEKIKVICKRWVLVLVGDMFGTKTDTHIDRIFDQAKHAKTIRLPDLGLETVRPVFFHDALEGILRAGFGLEKERRCFVFSKHPYTALSVVHAIQKVDPLLRIDFTGKAENASTFLPEGTYLLPEDYPMMRKLQQAYESHTILGLKSTMENMKQTPVITKRISKQSGLLFTVMTCVISIFFPLVLPATAAYISEQLGNLFLFSAQGNVQKGSLESAKTFATASGELYALAIQSNSILTYELGVVNLTSVATRHLARLQAEYQLSQVVSFTIAAAQDFNTLSAGSSISPQATLTDSITAIKNIFVTWDSLTIHLLPQNIKKQLEGVAQLKTKIGGLLDIAPQLLGFDRPKSYTILFEDANILRPGGGKMLAYSFLTIKQGKLAEMTFHSVSQADSSLKGHVEPPFVVRRYMKQLHWFLGESNFSIENIKNGQTAAFFLQQELGIRSDGVIVVDSIGLAKLLDIVGNITLNGKTVSSADFLNHLHSLSLLSSKEQYVIDILSAIKQEIGNKHISLVRMGEGFLPEINEKHVLFAFSDVPVQQVFTVNGMSSALWDTRTANTNTLNDFTAINQTDIVNADSMHQRTIMQDMTINPAGTVSGVITIHYSQINMPGQVYLHFVLPEGAQITNISYNSIPQSRFPAVIDPKEYEAQTFKAPKGIEIEHAQEGGKELYGLLLITQGQTSDTVTFSYSLSQKLDLTQDTSIFDELLFKQPGTLSDTYSFSLHYPNTLKLIHTPSGATITNNTAQVEQPLITDEDYQFVFIKQQ